VIVLSSYCLHQVRVCLSLSRLTNDVKIRQRCEELAMDFAERIGGKDDFDIVEARSDQQATSEARRIAATIPNCPNSQSA
jgi:hypothetical protein